jgi:hypothetical protein
MRRVAVLPGDLKRVASSVLISIFFAPIFILIATENDISSFQFISIILAFMASSVLIAWKHKLENVVALWTTIITFFFIFGFLRSVINIESIALPLSITALVAYYFAIVPRDQWYIYISLILMVLFASCKFTVVSPVVSLLLFLIFFLAGFYLTPICQAFLASITEPLNRITQFRIGQLISFPFSILATSLYFSTLFRLSMHLNLGSYDVNTSHLDVDSFFDWLFFSAYLILTGNLVGITPTNLFAKAMVMLAIVSGIFWLIIYLGLVMTSFQLKPFGGDN